jgi:hypothetical protein
VEVILTIQNVSRFFQRKKYPYAVNKLWEGKRENSNLMGVYTTKLGGKK